MASRWATTQRSTPSFAVTTDHDATVLDQPMPRALTRHSTPGPRQTHAADPLLSPKMQRSHTPRARPVHEDLLERGRLYEQRREALQEKAAARELRQCRGVPHVSQMAKDLAREGPIRDRLLRLADEKRRKEEFQTQRLEIAEAAVMKDWFKPKLSRKGGRTQGRTLHSKSEAWASKKEERVAERRRELVVEEMRDLQDAPAINPRSEMLAAVRREREGMAGYTHIEAMLERDRLAKLAQWEREQRAAEEAARNATPRITQRAATVDTGGATVFERLAQKAAEREERLAQLQQERHRSPAPRVGAGPSLAAKGQAFQEQREARLEHLRNEERRRHRPAINPVSGAIAAQLPESTVERLQRPARSDTPSRGPSKLQAPAAAPSVDPTAAYARFMAGEQKKQARLQEARDRESDRELAQCTFRPAISDAVADESASQDSTAPALQRLYDRTTQWQRRRDEKLDKARGEREQDQAAYSYAPVLGDAPPAAPTPSSLYGGDGRAWGFNEYVERLAEARRVREEPHPAVAPNAAGPPQLGTPRGPISSLAPPVRPPHHAQLSTAPYEAAAARLADDLLR